MKSIKVRYLRPSKEDREWEQRLLVDAEKMIVSSFVFHLEKPFSPLGEPLIEDGYSGVLFDFFYRWYNVVKVFDHDEELVGYYSDIRTPPEKMDDGYIAKDLFLDIWVEPNGEYFLLDREEFESSDIDGRLKEKVESILNKLVDRIEENRYPPEEVKEFDISSDHLEFST